MGSKSEPIVFGKKKRKLSQLANNVILQWKYRKEQVLTNGHGQTVRSEMEFPEGPDKQLPGLWLGNEDTTGWAACGAATCPAARAPGAWRSRHSPRLPAHSLSFQMVGWQGSAASQAARTAGDGCLHSWAASPRMACAHTLLPVWNPGTHSKAMTNKNPETFGLS